MRSETKYKPFLVDFLLPASERDKVGYKLYIYGGRGGGSIVENLLCRHRGALNSFRDFVITF